MRAPSGRAEVDQDPAREPLPSGRTRCGLAMSCAQHPGTFLGARYRRIASPPRADESQRRDPTLDASRSGTWASLTAPRRSTPAVTTSNASHPERAQEPRTPTSSEAMALGAPSRSQTASGNDQPPPATKGSSRQTGFPFRGAEGIRTPDLLVAKVSPACPRRSATVHPVRLLLATQVRGCAGGARNRTAGMLPPTR